MKKLYASILCSTLFSIATFAQAPVANDDNGPGLVEDGPGGTVNIIANDTDPQGNPTAPVNGVGTFTVDLDPGQAGIQTTYISSQGSWTLNTATGVVTFVPGMDYNGTAVITYVLYDPDWSLDNANITFVVAPVNDPPVANPQSVNAFEDTPQSVVLTGTDIESPPASLSYTVLALPAHGILSGVAPNLTYTPAANYFGSDSFTFRVTDPNGSQSSIALVSISVQSVNDAPVANNDIGPSLLEDGPNGSVNIIANDSDVDGIPAPPYNTYIPGSYLVDLDLSDFAVQTSFTDAQGVWTFDNGTGILTFDPGVDYNGTAIISYRLLDLNGGAGTGNVQFDVVAVNDPPVANCMNLTGYLNGSGNFNIIPAMINNGSTDDGGIVSMTVTPSSLSCANLGANNVTLTVYDAQGLSSTCVGIVTILDSIHPSITSCPSAQTIVVGAGCTALIPNYTSIVSATDNCGTPTFTQSPAAGSSISLGATVSITVQAIDPSGNASSCVFNLTAIGPEMNVKGNNNSIPDGDITPSTTDFTDYGSALICGGQVTQTFVIENTGTEPLDITGFISTDMSYMATAYSSPILPGNSGTISILFQPLTAGLHTSTISILNSDCDESPYNFTLSGYGYESDIDVYGNSVFIANNDVTPSLADHTDFGSQSVCAGTISRTFTIDINGTPGYGVSGISANISGANASDFTISANPASAIPWAMQTTTFTITFNPSAAGLRTASVNLMSNDCDENPYTFAISGTGIDPEINVTGNTLTIADGDVTPRTLDHTDFGSVLECTGNIIRTFTVQNTGTSTLTIGAITITGANPSDFSLYSSTLATLAPGGSGMFQIRFDPTAIGLRTAVINVANDDCDENPYNFAVQGTGNADITSPVFTSCPGTITVNADPGVCNTVVSFTTPAATDNCPSGLTVTQIAGLPSGSSFPVGLNTVTFRATDGSGNFTDCSFQVNVNDNTPPVAVCSNITAYVNSSGTATIDLLNLGIGSSDNCACIANRGYDLNNDGVYEVVSGGSVNQNFSCPAGTRLIPVRITDCFGLNSFCVAQLTILDTFPPVAVCQNITVNLNTAGSATILPVQLDGGSSDACGIASRTVSQSTFTCANIGANNVTLTVTDVNGNSSTCTSVVTVVDTVRPTAICHDTTLHLSTSGTLVISPSDINLGSYDACGILTMSVSPSTFNCSQQGVNIPITLTVTDVNGNTSTCVSLTDVYENLPPVAICHNTTVYLDGSGNATVTAGMIDNGSYDECGIVMYRLQPFSSYSGIFSCSNVGTNAVTLELFDSVGNMGSCSSTVTVLDTVRPIALAQNITVTLSGGTATVTAAAINNGSSDACGIATMSVSPNTFTCANLGPNTVTLTVTDVNGNTSTTSAVVTVLSNLTASASVSNNVSCFGGNNGQAVITPSGGAGPFTYAWTPSGGTGATSTGLTAGNYTCVVTDAGGCTTSATVSITQPTAIALSAASQTNVTNYGGNNGAASINTPTGGTTPYSYNWTPGNPAGDGTVAVTGLTAGTWTCTVTDGNGCTASQTFLITQPAAALNFDGANDHVTTANNPIYSNLALGQFTMEAWIYPTSLTGHRSIIRHDGDYNLFLFNGTLNAEAFTSGGSGGPYNNTKSSTLVSVNTWTHVAAVWNGSSFRVYINGIDVTGTTVTGSAAPTSNLSIGGSTVYGDFFQGNLDEVRIWNRALCQSEIQNNMSCEIPAAGSGLLANYHFNQGTDAANNSGVTTLNDASGNSINGTLTNFTLNGAASNWVGPGGVTSGVSCSAFVPPAVTVTPVSQTNVACFAFANGAASVSASGGSGLIYNWTPGNPTGDGTPSVTGLTAGTWTCTVTNSCGGTGTATFNITQPSSPLVVSTVSLTNVSCNGGSNGAATVLATGGNCCYTYNWSPGNPTGDGTASVTGLTAGMYACQVTDAGGCSYTHTVSITQPTPLVAASSAGSILCNGGSTTVTVTGSGGISPYTGTGTFTVTAGTYTYTVTDANGCTGTTSVTVTQPTAVTASLSSTPILCNGGTSTVTVSASGGTSPYSGTGTFIVTPGSYSYLVTDANGCPSTTSVTITQPAVLVSNATSTSITCNGGSAQVTVSASGGTTPYSGTGTFTVTAGTYSYIVTDANGCSSTSVITVTQPTSLVANSSATSIQCNGGSAIVTVIASGGTGPYTGTGAYTVTAGTYTYVVTDANGCTSSTSITVTQPSVVTASASATSIACNGGTAVVTVTGAGGTSPYTGTGTFTVTAGAHVYTVTDANGCTATTSITVTEPSVLTASSSATAIACNGGSATVTVAGAGGTSPYTGTGTFTVAAGTYSYTVTDANGCTATTSITVTEPAVLTASSSATAIACNGGSATITVAGGGGTSPYTGTGTFTVTAGTYSYTVTDANGCTATTSITVTEPAVLTASSSATAIACNGGTATITVVGAGGTSPYSGDGSFTANAGTYSYTVTDANGCNATTSITITEPTAISTSVATVNVLCNGDSTGSIDLTVTGGTGAYTFDWNNGAFTTEDLTNIPAGTYSGVLTDANGCTESGIITITEPPVLSTVISSQSDPTTCSGADGAIDQTVNGGTLPYSFLWSNSSTTEDLTGLVAGAYSCDVTDVNGCTTQVSATLNDPNPPTVTLALALDTMCFDDGSYTLTGESPVGGTFSGPGVSAGTFNPSVAGVGMHVITYSFTDGSGCSGSAIDSIYVDLCLNANVVTSGSDPVIYPNPSNGAFTIQTLDKSVEIQITDATGKLIEVRKVNAMSREQFSLAASGIYWITSVAQDGSRSTQRIVVTR